ncbi:MULTISPECIES: amidohydrolase family protein [Streptomycetaceae]|uniref:Amidohydrolase 2 n=1 Tax=Streptantibioticus cattleyicolor (strain ATCC 35852 / DSM 46488 / JCM 4925 / NBRC 14057 / NRRL 8057) TaxID=1003195 RepID=F8JQU2_STREN|nr:MULTISPECIES: amidohydrolase family protein [Streptomycetaceae]AEW92823.1 amidohydrolase 2 [Streptantibioticus cattleyicolor NRRL 8057 = DSM 46488]MYS57582.1 amidohydrolase family protein [Streptomyces sp. SID5468]CCB73177.1 Amidohydrolase 2 [Streptantibioticus cattleyicolor NRRL 8057 = DSM 46488]
MSFPARIDVHQHLVPPVWADALAAIGHDTGGWAVPAWSTGGAIAMMDEQSIATGVLSVTAPGVHLGDDTRARTLARAVNEYGAEVVKDRPDRFGHFASVPLPDVDAALAETAYALDTLGADGVVLMSNVHGRYLGDPGFEPLWDELDRRRATVFVHPAQPPMAWLPGTPAPLADFVFDTTRTALNLVLNGVIGRHPHVRVILAHGGGFLPYAAYRFSGLTSIVVDPGRTADDILRDLRRFYFDTALSASPSALPALLAFAEPGHVLYGSDWPFAPQEAGSYYNGYLEAYPGFAPGQAEAIDRGNAEVLFPRLAR